MKLTKVSLTLAVLAALSLLAAACSNNGSSNGGDTSGPTTTTTTATEPTTSTSTSTTATTIATTTATTAPTQQPSCEEIPIIEQMDITGDNMITIGVATPGPRDDQSYYQALVESVAEFADINPCLTEPIIVDRITTNDAATALRNLARQDVDFIAVGSGQIAGPLDDLTEEFSDIFWYCNCGAGYKQIDTLAQTQDDSSEISYTAGYATGLLLQERGGNAAAFLGCCDLGFEKEAYMAFELGLRAVDESYSMTYTPTGNFPYDFGNSAGAVESLATAISEGADAVYPFLGGAFIPVVRRANTENLIVMSAGESDVCDETDFSYDIAVRYDAGDYFEAIMEELAAGTFDEGDIRTFKVGVDPQPGANICNPTPEQRQAMEQVYQSIKDGDLTDDFNAIKARAYAS